MEDFWTQETQGGQVIWEKGEKDLDGEGVGVNYLGWRLLWRISWQFAHDTTGTICIRMALMGRRHRVKQRTEGANHIPRTCFGGVTNDCSFHCFLATFYLQCAWAILHAWAKGQTRGDETNANNLSVALLCVCVCVCEREREM